MAIAYYSDKCGNKDIAKAIEWWTKAAQKGLAFSYHYLGSVYNKGEGVEQDFAKAVEYWTKGAERNDAISMANLGSAFYFGQGVPKDEAKAVEWWAKAAETLGAAKSRDSANNWKRRADKGCTFSQTELGWISYNGQGAERDFEKAIEWWTKAAEQDFFPAQLALGLAYHKGQGVPQDEKKAVEIWSKVDAFWPRAFRGNRSL